MNVPIIQWTLLILCFTESWIFSRCANEIRVVCYYTNWSVYRPGSAKFSPQNINPYLCTHLIYAFGGFTKENMLKPFDKYQDIEKGGYAKFTGLKTYNKNLKTMLAIGGWNEGSTRFSPMVASTDRRKELVKNIIKFLRQNHFDGLDLDWEYPAFRDGGKSRDRENYAQFVQELREEFDRENEKTGRPRLLLTMAVPAGIEYINKGYDIPKLTKYLDWMNILSYDYHSAFEPAVNHHAPLFAINEDDEYNYDAELNIDYTIKHYLKVGADKNKLVLGIPTYGRSYTLFNPEATDIGAPADGPGDMGEATRENGYLAYYEICENIKSENWTVVSPYPKAMGPFAYKGNQWVGYDDEEIARKKAKYVVENSLGGIMFWSIDNDDFRGNCHNKPYPLIEAAKEELLVASGLIEKEKSTTIKSLITKTNGRNRNKSNSTKHSERKTTSTTTEKAISRRNRIRLNSRRKSETTESSISKPRTNTLRGSKRRIKPTTTTISSFSLITPSYTTPAPPVTPDLGSDFKCEDEGFFPHPRDCKKYFWCLNGPSETGIVAHQFTCPAGLYFNKAADSCDYSQNVLCNKKLSRTTTTNKPETITKSTTLQATTTRLTTTTTARTTTEEIEYYDEYDDDKKVDSEDPQVIKELLNLIKKAGGIEQLEKQLSNQNDRDNAPNSNGEHTTKATDITAQKSIFEKVLNKVSEKRKNTPSYTALFRNKGTPKTTEEVITEKIRTKSAQRGRPEYTYISRKQVAKEVEVDEVEEEDDNGYILDSPTRTTEKANTEITKTSKRTFQKEYVTIRRNRPQRVEIDKVSTVKPEYKTIQRSNTNTNEETSTIITDNEPTSKYVTLRRSRPTTPPNITGLPTTEMVHTSLEYKEIRTKNKLLNEDSLKADSNESLSLTFKPEKESDLNEESVSTESGLYINTLNLPDDEKETEKPKINRLETRRSTTQKPSTKSSPKTSKSIFLRSRRIRTTTLPSTSSTKTIVTRRKPTKNISVNRVVQNQKRLRYNSSNFLNTRLKNLNVDGGISEQNAEEMSRATELRSVVASQPSTLLPNKEDNVEYKHFARGRVMLATIPPQYKHSIKPVKGIDVSERDISLISIIPEHSKVLLHGSGVIECLDQGNFPHPVSCKKFISCAKMENGRILGWEYTCPKNLSFDPVGGICNWAPELECYK